MMRQWRMPKLSFKSQLRRLSTSLKSKFEDEGCWSFSNQWWGSDSEHHSHSVFRATSTHGNGIVSVLAYPSSSPAVNRWPKTEEWLRNRYAEVCSDAEHDECFKILGYQWRVLRFNDITRQSAVKVMATTKMSDPSSVYYMQQPHVLAVPWVFLDSKLI